MELKCTFGFLLCFAGVFILYPMLLYVGMVLSLGFYCPPMSSIIKLILFVVGGIICIVSGGYLLYGYYNE